MSRFDNEPIFRAGTQAAIDEGLRAFMVRVFGYMAVGLGISALSVLFVMSNESLLQLIFATPLYYVFLFAPLGLVLFLSARIGSLSASTAQGIFFTYSGLVGASLTLFLMQYSPESVMQIFLVSASVFGSMSLYGYTTNKDLTSMGSFMTMGLFGIIIASLLNMFFKNGAMSLFLSVLTVIVFTVLTAYDTQRIKELYFEADSQEVASKKAVYGALILYLDFINIFLTLLRLFGSKRD